MIDDLKLIKKHYGEKMMHLCRELFSTLLETPGLLYSLMEKSFAPNHYLYDDIVFEHLEGNFKNYIYSLLNEEEKEKNIIKKDPFELMEEAGYILYECKNERDIQKFRKYYAFDEKLCTFNGGRLDKCYVFFAVKKNVKEIRRSNFKHPEREDEYGTSVISIQFTRGDVNTLSIKNRYNHKVSNPDATFSNNLDNIIPGLTVSFEKKYGLNIHQDRTWWFSIPGYVRVRGKFYKKNMEINNIYYCPDNMIIDNFEIIRDYQEKEKYIIADYFIIDLVNKEVRLYDKNIEDSFIDGLYDIKKIEVIKDKETGVRIVTIIPNYGSEIIIEIDKCNRIIGYKNNNLREVGKNFLHMNRRLNKLTLDNLERVSDNFLKCNDGLLELSLPNLVEVKDYFFWVNSKARSVNFPNLRKVGVGFMFYSCIEEVSFPKLEEAGNMFMIDSIKIKTAEFPSLKKVGSEFMAKAERLKKIYLPNLVEIDYGFLADLECRSKVLRKVKRRIKN